LKHEEYYVSLFHDTRARKAKELVLNLKNNSECREQWLEQVSNGL